MTDKAFYQTAASEVAGGQLDQALWIKVGAEMPGADNVARQAKYIQLRARELARATAGRRAKGVLRLSAQLLVALLIVLILSAVYHYIKYPDSW
jgi:hypothetical protein